MIEIYKRGFIGKTQKLSETAGSVAQSVYRKRGDNPPVAEYGILPTPLIVFTNEHAPIYGRVPHQLRRIVEVVRGELERLKARGFSTSAARGLRDKLVADYIQENLSNQIEQDELWESLG